MLQMRKKFAMKNFTSEAFMIELLKNAEKH